MRALILAAALAVATVSQANVLIDFGTEGGYDGQMSSPTNAWTGGGWGAVPDTAFTNDTIVLTFNVTDNWQVGGNSYGGWAGSYLQRVSPFGGVDLNSPLQLEAKITAPAGMTFFDFEVMFQAVDGHQSSYRFIPDSYPWTSSAPFTSTMAIASSTTNLGTPYSISGGGAFDWSTDVIDQVKFQFQNAELAGGNPGPNTGTVVFEIDNIQANVPEPTVLAGLGVASLGLMLRKRQK